MRITRSSGRIIIRDRPGSSWGLGLFLLTGGVVAIAMPLGLATNAADLQPWERLASFGIGLGVSGGAIWWLRHSPGTRTELDLTRRRLRVVRYGIAGSRRRELAFGEVWSFQVKQGADDDGNPVWQPAALLRNGETIALSELWSHDRLGIAEAATVMSRACDLPSPPRPEILTTPGRQDG
jgi:hypothetical protein